jgi:hypothetical protein
MLYNSPHLSDINNGPCLPGLMYRKYIGRLNSYQIMNHSH